MISWYIVKMLGYRSTIAAAGPWEHRAKKRLFFLISHARGGSPGNREAAARRRQKSGRADLQHSPTYIANIVGDRSVILASGLLGIHRRRAPVCAEFRTCRRNRPEIAHLQQEIARNPDALMARIS